MKETVKNIKVVRSQDGVYDTYDEITDTWMFSRNSADNLLKELSKFQNIKITFVDKFFKW